MSETRPDDAFTAGLGEIRELIRADGGDIELSGRSAGSVQLRLILDDAGCADCVLPAAMLERLALRILQAHDPSITAVTIDDPRA